jgi:hypothetical protein
MTHTKYSNLTDGELLIKIDDARQHSPIIDELAGRFEKLDRTNNETNVQVECPVCEAKLEAGLDEDNNIFTLELQ